MSAADTRPPVILFYLCLLLLTTQKRHVAFNVDIVFGEWGLGLRLTRTCAILTPELT